MKNDKVQNLRENNRTGPLKVLFITHNYIRHKSDFSGVFLHLLAKKLIEQQIEIFVVAPHDAGLPEYEEIDGVKIYRYRYADKNGETLAYRGDMHRQIFSNPFKLFRLRRFLKESFRLACSIIEKEKISVVSIQWVIPNGVVGRWLKRKYGGRIKLFFSSHGTDVRLLTRFAFLMTYLKATLLKSDGWTVVSSFLKKLIVDKYPKLESKIIIAPMPNDEQHFCPNENIKKEDNLLVAVSRFTVQKRLDYLIKAIDILNKKNTAVRLEIYGTGPERENLKNLIEESNLSEVVRLKEPVNRELLKTVYNRASMIILNSYNEGFGLVLTEAMLCRTAVIGSDSGGISDIIKHEQTGLLVPQDNAEELAKTILRLVEEKPLREQLAEAGYHKALEKFSSGSAGRQFAELFRP